MTLDPVQISRTLVDETLELLREAGRRPAEGIVLWLGRRNDGVIHVERAHVPIHESDRDYFRIPPEGMAALLRTLGDEGLFVAAQVHSHPGSAFHSEADDRWAIVRHVGALSLVVPHLARATTAATFLTDVAIFRLSATNLWTEVVSTDTAKVLALL